jgi:multisubunit Na+/H+ antiporter MnhB subunit
MFLNNWKPNICPECGQPYVNSYRSVASTIVLGMSLWIAAIWFLWGKEPVYGDLGLQIFSFSIVAFILIFYGLVARPIKYEGYEKLVIYSKRPWWGNILLFVVLPISVFILMLYFLVNSSAGG